MGQLVLNIYDKKGKQVVRQAKGDTYDIMMGTIEELMDLLDIENTKDSFEVLRKISGAYREIKNVFSTIFGDVTDEEWKCVKVKELLPLVLDIVKFTFEQMNTVPTDPNM